MTTNVYPTQTEKKMRPVSGVAIRFPSLVDSIGAQTNAKWTRNQSDIAPHCRFSDFRSAVAAGESVDKKKKEWTPLP